MERWCLRIELAWEAEVDEGKGGSGAPGGMGARGGRLGDAWERTGEAWTRRVEDGASGALASWVEVGDGSADARVGMASAVPVGTWRDVSWWQDGGDGEDGDVAAKFARCRRTF